MLFYLNVPRPYRLKCANVILFWHFFDWYNGARPHCFMSNWLITVCMSLTLEIAVVNRRKHLLFIFLFILLFILLPSLVNNGLLLNVCLYRTPFAINPEHKQCHSDIRNRCSTVVCGGQTHYHSHAAHNGIDLFHVLS